MNGFIIKSTGSWYQVQSDDGIVRPARMRGRIRLEDIKETNPVAVGDRVTMDLDGEECVISEILPRENYFVRQSVKKTGHTHVIAANIDQALLVVSLSHPRTSLGFIDRFTVAAESFRIPQMIVFNKRDLWTAKETEAADVLTALYRSIGAQCLQTSALTDEQQDLKKLLSGKKTLIAGHSGAGKSTLINQLSSSVHQKTGSVSDFSSKGIHTTTFAEMFNLDVSTYVIDTPGIKELGMVDMQPEEISDYFAEMRDVRLDCKFGARCLHISEPGCPVKTKIENGEIAISRYESYLSIVGGGDNRK